MWKSKLKITITLLSLTIFSGCTIPSLNFKETKTGAMKANYIHSTAVTDFSKLTEQLLISLCPSIKKLDNNEPLYIIDFTNLRQLENHSELGFVLSSELKTIVTQKCKQTVHEIEFSKILKIGKNGTKLLTRKRSELKNTTISDTSYALVGNYIFTQRQVIIYLKLIDLYDGVIIKSSTIKTPITDELIMLEQKSINIKTNSQLKDDDKKKKAKEKKAREAIKTTADPYIPLVI
jgi:TolB-like protein